MEKRKAATAKKGKARKTDARIEFNHAMVYVRDLPAALKFYADGLGFKVIDEHPGAYARLRPPKGGGTIALHVAAPGEQISADGVRLYFEVKELDGVCAKLQTAGFSFTKRPAMMPWGWRHAYLNDPDGREVSLYWAGQRRFQKTVMRRTATA